MSKRNAENTCGAWLRQCRKCGRKYTKEEPQGPRECPDCGEPRGQCTSYPAKGRTRCKHHGGATLTGRENPAYKHGRHVRRTYEALPARLRERVTEIIDDPNLLSLRENVAVADARLSELYARLDTGESGGAWKAARESLDDLLAAQKFAQAARDAHNAEGVSEAQADGQAAMSALAAAIKRGARDQEIIDEIVSHTRYRADLASREHKMLTDKAQVITSVEAMSLVEHLLHVIEQEVSDRRVRSRIGEGFAKLVNLPDAESAESAESAASEGGESVVDAEFERKDLEDEGNAR